MILINKIRNDYYEICITINIFVIYYLTYNFLNGVHIYRKITREWFKLTFNLTLKKKNFKITKQKLYKIYWHLNEKKLLLLLYLSETTL